MKRITAVGILLILVFFCVIGYLMFTGPRMIEQSNIREYQAVMPPPPEGAVPTKPIFAPLPSETEARAMKNPLPATAENIDRGRTYFGYYCAFCHGSSGAGDGPVGVSYIPTAPELRSPRLRAMSDGELLRAVFTNPTHAPVMEHTVQPEYRWYLVLYVRELAKKHP